MADSPSSDWIEPGFKTLIVDILDIRIAIDEAIVFVALAKADITSWGRFYSRCTLDEIERLRPEIGDNYCDDLKVFLYYVHHRRLNKEQGWSNLTSYNIEAFDDYRFGYNGRYNVNNDSSTDSSGRRKEFRDLLIRVLDIRIAIEEEIVFVALAKADITSWRAFYTKHPDEIEALRPRIGNTFCNDLKVFLHYIHHRRRKNEQGWRDLTSYNTEAFDDYRFGYVNQRYNVNNDSSTDSSSKNKKKRKNFESLQSYSHDRRDCFSSIEKRLCSRNVQDDSMDAHGCVPGGKQGKLLHVTPPPGEQSYWCRGEDGSDLIIRKSTIEIFEYIWGEFERNKKIWDAGTISPSGFVALLSGSPGIGKSWSSNAMLWFLIHNKQNVWFHSAQKRTITIYKHPQNGGEPICIEVGENKVDEYELEPFTWFLYDAVDNGTKVSNHEEFRVPGDIRQDIPCIIFSDPAISNYAVGMSLITGHSTGGPVDIRQWMPTWELDELKEAMPVFYKSLGGQGSPTPIFEKFIEKMYDVWGGIPRRIFQYYNLLVASNNDLETVVEQAKTDLRNLMKSVAPQIIARGAVFYPSEIGAFHETRETRYPCRKVVAPSWVLHMVPERDEDHNRDYGLYSYKFCSPLAEFLFAQHLGNTNIETITRTRFCSNVFCKPTASTLRFERYLRYMLVTGKTKCCVRKISAKRRKGVNLPRCKLVQCDMKDGLQEFKDCIRKAVESRKNTLIEPMSDQKDAIDMFLILKDGRIYAMQDTISRTHSFHPVEILEYMSAAREALRGYGWQLSTDDFFKHVVVVPSDNQTFELNEATLSGTQLDDIQAVNMKFREIGLGLLPRRYFANLTTAKDHLLAKAKKRVENITWVLTSNMYV